MAAPSTSKVSLKPERTIFEKSTQGQRAIGFTSNVAKDYTPPPLDESMQRQKPAGLPEISEIEVVRHFTRLSQLNFSIDTNFYPLGSCTMKYNPKINDRLAALPGMSQIHPLQPDSTVQGALHLLDDLEQRLVKITGMDAFTLQPAAGAHGEFAGLHIIKAHLQHTGEKERTEVIVPDSAHGTNPSSAAQAGFDVVTIGSTPEGEVDVEELKKALGPKTAALMLTNPNTLGLFEGQILEIAKAVHDAGAMLYYDGANLNALLGLARPGDMGFDVVHLNLHKTFSTPHGGGGPGAGPVGVKKHLEAYLPAPRLKRKDEQYYWDTDRPYSIGKVRSFHGNFGVLVRAYAYILVHGADGLERVSRAAIINANYLKQRLKDVYKMYNNDPCMHEFIMLPDAQLDRGFTIADIAKRILDFGMHSPTLSWPVRNCLMVEPTETETRETLDAFADALLQIDKETQEDPELIKTAPHNLPVRRMDEVKAARELDLRYSNQQD